MKNSPLQAKRLFFTKVRLDAVPKVEPSASCDVQATAEVSQISRRDWVVILTVSLGLMLEKPAQYRGTLEVVGFFQVSNDWPDDKIESLVYANGSAVLYGAAREMVCNITARGPYDMVVLPTASFVGTGPKQPKRPEDR